MNRAGAFCASLLGVGALSFTASLLMAFGLVPDPTAGQIARPLWGILAIVGLLYAVVGAWLLMVLPRHTDTPDVLVGYVLFHTPRPAVLLAALEALLFAGAWGALALGYHTPSAREWTLLLGLTVAALFLTVLGTVALVWSRGRGTRTRKASAARGLASAYVLALVPWLFRAAFPA